jgi:hypothetical protein
MSTERRCQLCGGPVVAGQRAMVRVDAYETDAGELLHVERDYLRVVHTRCYLAADPAELDALLGDFDDDYPPTW